MKLLHGILVRFDRTLALPFAAGAWLWHFFSPLLGARCRYYPSCSEYAAQALLKHGFFYGCYLTARRLLRCNAFFPGGIDFVPRSSNSAALMEPGLDASRNGEQSRQRL